MTRTLVHRTVGCLFGLLAVAAGAGGALASHAAAGAGGAPSRLLDAGSGAGGASSIQPRPEPDWTWSAAGPHGAEIATLAASPLDPQLLFAATARGGLFRSTNNGVSWSHAGGDIATRVEGAWVTSIAFDPGNASVVYAGTRHRGLFVSTDGGARWTPAARGLGEGAVLAIALHPRRSQILLIATPRGIFRSSDGGGTAAPVRLGAGQDRQAPIARFFAFDPFRPGHVFAATAGQGVWHSGDAGETFQPWGEFPEPIEGFALDPTNGQILFALTQHELRKSLDGGLTWTRLDPAPGEEPAPFTALALDPARPDRAAVADHSGRIYVSGDGGLTWESGTRAPLPGPVPSLHFTPGGGGAAPSSAGLLAATGRGPYRIEAGGEAIALTAGLDEPVVSQLLPCGTGPGRLLAGTDLGLYASRDGGLSWTPIDLPAAWGRRGVNALASHPSRPNALFAGTDGGLFWSSDGGVTWRHVLGDLVVSGLCARPGEGASLYVAGRLGQETVVLSGDAVEDDWIVLDREPEGGLPWLRSHPRLPQSLFVGIPAMRWSPDGGASWRTAGLSGVRDLALDAFDPFHLLAATAGGLFESRDGGESWNPIRLQGSAPERIASGIGNPGFFAAFAGDRAFIRRGLESDWVAVPVPLRSEDILSAAVDASGEILYIAGPHGVMRAVIPEARTPSSSWVGCTPNPFTTSTRVSILGVPREVLGVSIYSVGGGLVRVERFRPAMHGSDWEWNGRNDFGDPAASGIYLVLLHTAQGEVVGKVTKLD